MIDGILGPCPTAAAGATCPPRSALAVGLDRFRGGAAWPVGQGAAAPAGPQDEHGRDRLGAVLHRRLRHPGPPGGGRGGEKKIRAR